MGSLDAILAQGLKSWKQKRAEMEAARGASLCVSASLQPCQPPKPKAWPLQICRSF